MKKSKKTETKYKSATEDNRDTGYSGIEDEEPPLKSEERLRDTKLPSREERRRSRPSDERRDNRRDYRIEELRRDDRRDYRIEESRRDDGRDDRRNGRRDDRRDEPRRDDYRVADRRGPTRSDYDRASPERRKRVLIVRVHGPESILEPSRLIPRSVQVDFMDVCRRAERSITIREDDVDRIKANNRF
jgi:hypothetical protein